MAATIPRKSQTIVGDEEGLSEEVQQLLLTLPKERGWGSQYLYKHQGIWIAPRLIEAINSVQKNFKAYETDLLLVSLPKSGTTWLKALIFSIVNRKSYTLSDNPLLTTSPHELVPFLEIMVYGNNQIPDLSNIPPPRLFATHLHCSLLPESIKTFKCKIVYICRNPLDNFISLWHFMQKARPQHREPLRIEEAFDLFCRGITPFGPFWDHVLGYWKASLENPHKVLFLKYEDMKGDIISQIKRLSEFLDYPFSVEEEIDGMVMEISRLCSFENMKEMEPNKSGRYQDFEYKNFFRKAAVGDWANYLTPSMAERLNETVEDILKGSGLSFKM